MSSEYIYTMYRVDKFYGADRQVLSNISLSFFPGAKIGVLGPNGAGKSTVLRIMAGKEEPSSGAADLAPNATVGLLEQEPELDPGKTVRENVEDGVRELRDLLDRFNQISAQFSEPDADFDALLAEQAKVQDQVDRRGAWQLEEHLDHAMDALRLPEGDRDVASLSGGERRRVALCRLLLSAPDLLLLDEPTNHLDAESVFWLERFLAEYKGTVVAVTHDRYFLDNVAGWILELDRGRGIPYEGNYSGWLEQKQVRLQIEEKQSSARQRTLARELEWVRLAPKARHAKSKARLGAYEKLLADEDAVRLDKVEIHIPPGPRLGDIVIEAKGVSKGFGDRLLFENLEFSLPPAGIVGVIGPNGAGKTTLFRMIAGEETPDSGELRIGDTVQLGYVDQSRASLDPKSTVWKEISGGQDIVLLGKKEINSRQYTSWFNFRGGDQQKPVGKLSGGERNRVHLAKMLKSGGNVLLLDEPTNDLDVDTLRALEDALLDFAGCAVVITHDRWFLDRVATHILAFEGDSEVTWFEGDWAEYADWVRETRGPEALEPHRIKYKPLVRA
ncbi:MAG TPA: energy-dependent translational throttle protein EttA [Gaiellaceae bacterium]|jgi:ATP-binding cassette ChvD family protein|nr:energy-dependent translational throttle protein EttA [Gaiellaceae bacterium]